MSDTQATPHPGTVLFTVCAPPDVMPHVESAAAKSGAEFVGDFADYLTPDRTTRFPSTVQQSELCVALIDCDRDTGSALHTMQHLAQTFGPRVRTVALSTEAQGSFLVEAMRAGCHDVLHKPLQPAELSAAIQRFESVRVSPRGDLHQRGRMVTVLGVKGGVGTTTIAVHLAVFLARKHGKRVLLIDPRHELGHVALHLGLKASTYYFSEVLRNADRLDSDLLASIVLRHASGVDVIPSPDTCLPNSTYAGEALERAMQFLRERYDYVVIDASMADAYNMPSLVSMADEVALISTCDVASLRDLACHVEHFSLTEGFTTKLRVIANRAGSDSAISAEEVSSAIRFPVSITIPNSYRELVDAVNSGQPISPQARSPFAHAMRTWANALAPSAAARASAAPRPRWRSLWS